MRITILSIILLLVFKGVTYGQVDNEFWFVVPEITTRHAAKFGEPTFLRISSVGDSVKVTITMPAHDTIPSDPTSDTILAKIIVPAGEYRYYDLTQLIRKNYDVNNPGDGVTAWTNLGDINPFNIIESGLPGEEGIKQRKGIKIKSEGINTLNRNRNITVYCDRFNNNNKDIWSLKGKNALGKNFTIPSQNIFNNVYTTYKSDGSISQDYNSDPSPLNAFDIVATENSTTVTITPKQRIRHSGFVPNYYEKEVAFTVTLNEGETFSCVAMNQDPSSHLGGSIVTATAPIAISIKDDSMRPNNNNGYDTAGDQIIPDTLGGLEFVVMRGELSSDEEYAFVMSTKEGVTKITHTACGGGTTTFDLSGRGDIKPIQLNSYGAGSCNIDALHIEADQKIMVWHITGFGNEIGGGLIPSIDLCTGSKDVTVVRSSDAERFFLNIMTKDANRDDFKIYVDINNDGNYGVGEVFTLDPSWFQPAGTTGWYYLDKNHNEFTDNGGGAYPSPFGQKIIAGRPTRIVNEGRFHLGTIEGAGSGCKYGYFSSFSADTGSAVIGLYDKGIEKYCYGDTIQLRATGAESYKWWFEGDISENTFITADTIEDPLAILKPANSIWEVYKVRIEKDCYDGVSPWDTLDVEVQVYEKITAVFDTNQISPTCCSPVEIKVNNTPQNKTIYEWILPNETDTTNFIGIQYSDTILLTNHSQVPVDYDLQLVANKNYLCYDTLTIPVNVDPQITAKSSSNYKTGCNQYVEHDFSPLGSSTNYTTGFYYWGDGDSESFVAEDSTNIFTHIFQNTNETDTIYYPYLTLIDSVTGCGDTTYVDTIVVPGIARARYTIDQLGSDKCSPLDVKFTNNTNGDVAYEWSFYDGNLPEGTRAVNAYTNFSDTTISFTNTSNVPDTNFIYLKITKTNIPGAPEPTCVDTYGPDTIIVYPEPELSISPIDTSFICHGDSVSFSSSIDPIGIPVSYFWKFGNGNSSSQESPGYKIFNHYQNTDQNYNVELIAISSYGNCDDTSSTVVNVEAFVDSKLAISSDTAGCSTFQVEVQNITPANSYSGYNWQTGTATDATDNFLPFNLNYTNTTTDPIFETIILENKKGACTAYDSIELVVFPEITADFDMFNAPDTICSNDTISFRNRSYFTSIPSIPVSSNTIATFEWDFGDGTSSNLENPFKRFVNNTEVKKAYTITLTAILNGCEQTYTDQVFVYPKVKAVLSTDDVLLCFQQEIEIENNSKNANSFDWSFSDTTSGFTSNTASSYFYKAVNNSVDDTLHTYIYLKAYNSGCISYDTLTVQIYPDISISISPDIDTGCSPHNVSWENNTTGGDLSYRWDFGNDVVSNAADYSTAYVNNSYTTDTTYLTRLIASNEIGCSDTIKYPIHVYHKVSAELATDKLQICAPSTIQLSNNSKGADSYLWTFNDSINTPTSDTVASVLDYFVDNALDNVYEYTVLLEVEANNCTDVDSLKIKAYPDIVATISPDVTEGCSPLDVIWQNNSSGGSLSYDWDYKNGETSNNTVESVSFLNTTFNDTTFIVEMIATNEIGCSDTAYESITVFHKVKAEISTDEIQICTPATIQLQNNSIGATNYLWTFKDSVNTLSNSSSASVLDYDVNNPSTNNVYEYTVLLEVEANNCSDVDSLKIKAYPEIIANIAPSVGQGCSPLNVSWINQTSGGNLTYDWNFGNGEISTVIQDSTIYSNRSSADSVYNIQLIATNDFGCSDTAFESVLVYREIDAKFTIQKQNNCSPVNATLKNTSLNGDIFKWVTGLPNDTVVLNTNENVSLTYNSQTTNDKSSYNLELYVIDQDNTECSDTIIRTLEILPEVVADFSMIDSIGCSPLTTAFENLSTGYKLNSIWKYGDDDFSVNTGTIHEKKFSNLFVNSITKNIQLVVFDSIGCFDTLNRSVTIYPEVKADFSFVKTDSCTPVEVAFNMPNSALNGNEFFWRFGDGETASTDERNITKVFDNQNLNEKAFYFVNLYSKDTLTQCSDDTTKTILIHPRLDPDFRAYKNNIETYEGCNPLNLDLTNLSTGGEIGFYWDFFDDQSSTLTSPVHRFKHFSPQTESFNVTLFATQLETGCEKQVSKEVSVYSYLNAKFGITDNNVNKAGGTFDLGGCHPFDVHIIDSSISNKDFLWDFGYPNADTVYESSPIDRVVTYTNSDKTVPLIDSTYLIKLIVENVEGCRDSMEKKVMVYPNPIADFDFSTVDGLYCHPVEVSFNNHSVANSNFSYEWQPGDGSVLFEPDFTRVLKNNSFTKDTVFEVNLNVTSDHYCAHDTTIELVIHPKPRSIIDIDPDRGCSPFRAVFQNKSLGQNTGNDLDYVWDFDNGDDLLAVDDANSQTIIYTNKTDAVSTINVELLAKTEHGCLDTVLYPILVYPEIVADFTMSKIEGCSPLDVDFEDASWPKTDVGAVDFNWDLDEGITSENENLTQSFINTTNNDKVYDISLTSKSIYGCTDTKDSTITVFLSPNAEFLVYNLADEITYSFSYPDTIIRLKELVKPGPWNFNWSYGDGNEGNSEGEHDYAYTRWAPAPTFTYDIKLVVENSISDCVDSLIQTIKLNPPPPQISILNQDSSGCVPHTMTFNISKDYADDDNVSWNFGDNTSDETGANPTHEFTRAGEYFVTATINGDGGTRFDYQTVIVHPTPKPVIGQIPEPGTILMLPDDEITFYNNTKGGQKYIWYFGDGKRTDTLYNRNAITHIYDTENLDPGYQVSLWAESKYGCDTLVYSSNLIKVSGAGQIDFPNAFLPVSDTDPNGSYTDNDNHVFHPTHYGVDEYELWIFNRWGEMVFKTDKKEIGWNGKYGNTGNDLGQDVYFWKVKGKFENGVPFKKAGDVTLIREE